mmetsp:Transcript_143149/g.252647  ORF Transcript_143149/g.252647 Transcript_143149/m.252647 type:complete len:403 (-) Transcript_143149:30-1238(-)
MPWDLVSRFLFPAPPPSYTRDSFPQELIFVPKILELREGCPLEQCVPCLFLKYPSARFLILYLHSNAEDIGKCYSFCAVIREQFQVHVLAVEYPGYGICPGGPATADTVTENAFAVFRFIREVLKWPTDSIKIFGRSIGTGPAIALAVQYKVSGLILITPFLSIKDLLRDTVGTVVSYLVEERFPSKDRVHLIRSPVLIIHGQKDTLIPCHHGIQLYELCRGRKLLVCPEIMQHNTNLLTDVGYLVLPMLQFFALPDYCFEEIDVPAWAFEHCRVKPKLSNLPASTGCIGPCSFAAKTVEKEAMATPRHVHEGGVDIDSAGRAARDFARMSASRHTEDAGEFVPAVVHEVRELAPHGLLRSKFPSSPGLAADNGETFGQSPRTARRGPARAGGDTDFAAAAG